ncbi:hypothetical protein BK816_01235 [Boudabousia tangfeifanii]|uniref:NADPH-dependent FMN reductase-like domain-containing protein n=1 Tax=Boudabousia tangfeifanii TaxID=1912795 RepID=A0A1D9MIG3_9ACTO|nr:CE1759 family FMN reductase [Boudabousia tangfeifanii]AOZ72087.1 hypothetical protein BK816_01235 [Boudabousia tangfeifanii]
MKVIAINGGLGTPSATKILATQILDSLSRQAGEKGIALETELVNLRNLATAVTNVHLTGLPDSQVEAVLSQLEAADGVVMVSPVYAGSYAGMFKMFMDLVGNERLAGTPVLIGATGGSGRHSLMLDHAMRPLMSSLRAFTMPTGVFAATNDFGDTEQNELGRRIDVAAGQLLHNMQLAAPSNLGEAAASKESRGPVGPMPSTRQMWQGSGVPVQHLAAHSPEELLAQTQSDHQRNRGQIPYLNTNGASGRLRPEVDDFVPMGQLLGR